jgi:hypothetical protein
MYEQKKTIRDLLGINQASTPVQTASTIIGSLLFGGGLIGAINARKGYDYNKATKESQSRINEIGPAFDISAKAAEAGLESDLGAYQAKNEASTRQGLVNRGITNPEVADVSIGQQKAGLSGAYAAARQSLDAAKVNARTALSGSLSRYQQELAKKQYDAQVSRYYSSMGIWGAIGGFGAALPQLSLGDIGGKEETIKDNPGTPGTDERGGK